ncbi:MAG: glycoside hydrolase family 3 C-terminal domain-containing protein [Clostridia bacterium]|nr:glycoside hydrolase family 3 C-terminal domain-containing protein [Clostridia bacterium]
MKDPTFVERSKEMVAAMTREEKISQMLYSAPAIERLGIPAYNWWNEALHGVARSGQATVFPQAIAMAASFDDALLQKIADAIADEARAKYNEYKKQGKTDIYQGLTFWSPNINLFRDPRWGRGHETYGEDRYLTARMGTAFVKGLQGDHPRYRKCDATLKHFAVHSGPESLRHSFDAKVSDHALDEYYLWAFRYCIEHAQPAAVMSAYNRVNGEPASASPTLLQKILREKLGFDGYVVSDCGAITDIYLHHKFVATKPEAAALAVKAGCDLNCGGAYAALGEACERGLLSEDDLTKAVERLMYARLSLGMFDDDCPYDAISYDCVESPEHRALSRQMAEESIVLLENDGILPLSREMRVAIVGPNGFDDSVYLANYNGTPSEIVRFFDGIRAYTKAVRMAHGCDGYHPLYEAVAAANASDVVVMLMGLNPSMEGEEGDAYNTDASGDRLTLDLPKEQTRLLEAIAATKKPIVFVNISGSAVNLGAAKAHASAVLQCFYPGAEGGLALARILYGDVCPSGRLPVTFYRSVEDLPPFDDYSMENRTYRHFHKEVQYPFGYGKSYADIAETWIAPLVCEVENRSHFAAPYTVLCYDEEGALCDFCRLTLSAGEKKRISFVKYR